MKYMGSKNRIAKHLLPIMIKDADDNGITKWVEPFLGGGNTIDKVPSRFTRVRYDVNEHTVMAMIGIRDNVDKLPTEVSEAEYKSLRGTPPTSITSWIRFVCSFGGKLENGYPREKGSDDTTFVGYGKRKAEKQSPNLQDVEILHDSFENLSFTNSLIYCDPPYKGTTKYKTDTFDYDKFYSWCVKQHKLGNLVYVSEYDMPQEHDGCLFECVWVGKIKTNFAHNRTEATHKAVEKLFKVVTKKEEN